MISLSKLVKDHQRLSHVDLSELKPEWVDSLDIEAALTHKVILRAIIEGTEWFAVITPSFHGIAVKVSQSGNPETQSRLSRDLAERLNQ